MLQGPGARVSALRTLLASLLIVVAGVGALAASTDGFEAFTSETARRLAVRRQPQLLPPLAQQAALQSARGRLLDLAELHGRWLLVDFVYTRCATYCSVQGSAFAQLQERLATPIARQQVALLSISFDPAHDVPAELAAYKARSRDHGAGWIAARPTHSDDLQALLRAFGVRAIADGRGGFEHNAAIHVIDPQGRLVAVLDWDAPDQAFRFLQQQVAL